jgi:hypothetical protein
MIIQHHTWSATRRPRPNMALRQPTDGQDAICSIAIGRAGLVNPRDGRKLHGENSVTRGTAHGR